MSQNNARDKWLARLTDALGNGSFVKLTLAAYRGRDSALKNVFVRAVDLSEGPHLSFVYRYANRDVTKNFSIDEAVDLITDLVGAQFKRAHLYSTQLSSELEFREGRPARLIEGKAVHATPPPKTHDETKSRLISAEGSPWLKALGVTTSDGKVARGMEAKFRQINKFVEVLAALMSDAKLDASATDPLSVVDMGCGKGYLTFAAYDWLQRDGRRGHVRGIEAREELVQLCNCAAKENRFDELRFEHGSIENVAVARADVLMALHACDTATDDAIAKGIAAGAQLIIVSPCCQKELRPQLKAPSVLEDALRHGILLERHAEFVTDALRAALLEWAGYDTKVFEFISTEHTAKNLMIAATKRSDDSRREDRAKKVRDLAEHYGIQKQRLARHLGFSLSQEPAPTTA